MSEFECRNGHLMRPSDGPVCLMCGARVYRMDGMTDREMAARDREFERQQEEERDNETLPG